VTEEQQPAGDDAAATQKLDTAAKSAATTGKSEAATTGKSEAAPSEETAWDRSRGRRITVRSLIAVATVLGFVSIFAVWAKTQLLDTNQWTKTSSQLLENKAIRDQTATYLTDQLYANVDVTGELQSRLPGNLKLLAPAAAAGLRNLVQSAAEDALASPAVQAIWADANRAAHQEFVKIINGGGPNVSTQGGVVTLNLQRVLTKVGDRVGIPSGLLAKIPSSAANIVIFKSKQLKTAQDAAKALKALALVLPILVFAMFVLAVWLAQGHRRQTLLGVGFAFIVAGFLVLIARRIIGGEVTSTLASEAAVRPAANAAWDIGTSLLRTLGIQAVIIGIGVLIAGWLGGPSKPATAFRRMIAPYLRDRPEIAYGVVAALLLVFILWAPLPAARRPLFVLFLIAVSILGVVVLRRETESEFPAQAEAGTPVTVASDAGGTGKDAPPAPPPPAGGGPTASGS